MCMRFRTFNGDCDLACYELCEGLSKESHLRYLFMLRVLTGGPKMSLIVVTIYQASRAMKYMVSVEPTRARYTHRCLGMVCRVQSQRAG